MKMIRYAMFSVLGAITICGCATTDEPCVSGEQRDLKPGIVSDSSSKEFKDPKRLWATSYLWSKAPKLEVEKWLGENPDTKGKYVLIEFWNTWCPPCRRSISLLNSLHKKYGDELIVIGMCDESEEEIKKLKGTQIEFYSAMDTQARMKTEMNVFGVPHVIILEPEGHVIWEGFPLLKNYELKEEIIEKILAVGRAQKKGR